MRSTYEQRRENLRHLAKQWGGPTSLAKKLGALALVLALADLVA